MPRSHSDRADHPEALQPDQLVLVSGADPAVDYARPHHLRVLGWGDRRSTVE